MTIKCIIIDDEPLAIKVIESHLAEFKNIELVNSFGNPLDAIQTIESGDIDALFIDINMPGMNGLDFIKNSKHNYQVIITTAYREYAVESFELDVLDYLVKPIPFNRFLKTINKLSQILNKSQLRNNDYTGNKEPFIFVKVDKKLVKVLLKDILCIESLKDYIKIITVSGNYLVHKSLTGITEELPNSNFIRVHRSYTIAIDKIKSVEGNLIELAGKKIPIGRNYVKHVKETIFNNSKDLHT
ncbi:DNA-binding response regulator [Aquimarina sp. AD10]|uniref:LytR/AlgR family response regulator transcription factor n=1 Tax=Aquimarina sp. AD10 TaxID=1714849 RepID=UPI000E51CF82|nr:LytTR family DNA-binding domain-containing protein [Aquimarina sp. AD10]AXT60228.1 DNA-binding response regulator [Aquimarina sp. AD10]RKN01336.1 response regulator [Aquimarina sp. AD10]